MSEPHTVHIQAYKSGFMIHKPFVEKRGFIWPWISSCKLAFTTYTDRFVIVPDRAEAERVTKAWPQNQLDMSSVSKRKATSHFWHLCFKASSLLKLYLTYCMAVNSSYFLIWKKKPTRCYVKQWWKAVCDPKDMQVPEPIRHWNCV